MQKKFLPADDDIAVPAKRRFEHTFINMARVAVRSVD